jgi:hypothetical protein
MQVDAMPDSEPKSQSDKFKEAARKVEADEDEAAWEAQLNRIAKHKTVEKKAG